MKDTSKKKQILIRVITAVVLVLCVTCALYGALSMWEYQKSKNAFLARPAAQNGVFENYDPDADPDSDPEYLQQNRYITYTDHTGSYSRVLTQENYSDISPEIEFFAQYFKKLREGDFENFDSLFTDDYFKYWDKTADYGFSPQRIYDIKINYASSYSEKNTVYTTYQVSYCIMKNDGSFRNDIGSDETIPQYITLRRKGDEVLCHRIAYGYDPDFDLSGAPFVTGAVIASVSLLVFAAVIALTVIKGKKKNRKEE